MTTSIKNVKRTALSSLRHCPDPFQILALFSHNKCAVAGLIVIALIFFMANFLPTLCTTFTIRSVNRDAAFVYHSAC